MTRILLLLLGFFQFSTPAQSSNATIVLYLSETCYDSHQISIPNARLRDLTHAAHVTNETLLIYEDVCKDPTLILELLRHSNANAVIGSLEPDLCSPAFFLADFFNASLTTWNCPQEEEEQEFKSDNLVHNLGPSIMLTARRFTKLTDYMKWKSICIISSKIGWWPKLSQVIVLHLREIGIIPRIYTMITETSSSEHIEFDLNRLKSTHCRVIVICTPASSLGRSILTTIDKMNLTETLILLMDISALPSWSATLFRNLLQNPNVNGDDTSLRTQQKPENTIVRSLSSQHKASSSFPPLKTSNATKNSLLMFMESDASLNFDLLVIGNLKRIVDKDFTFRKCFALADIALVNDSQRTLLEICGVHNEITKWDNHFEEWQLKHLALSEENCENCASELTRILSIAAILLVSAFSVTAFLGVIAWARYHLLRKHINKGPYKVLLTATDFVFPQFPPESRRVDEGIEAMLCCWLQQLQEFGGPEVDKPDLLQGSSAGRGNNAAKTPLRDGSSPSLAKQIIGDSRVRYNGDLVQMKPIRLETNLELKAKTVEFLVLLHGLRHENLNPLIGCLVEPPRVYLVSEYCARGSLQDVLRQDDIKLDWSFRLSLLTDLVRGMKYLHSTPIRVHGYMSSRNCVIDARWVLKVTDYGLPNFFDIQGINREPKTARELLWTAPELLRQPALRKKGTQAGDVYSFGIIMQEVVVRGEPFCMLALTPEEIINKIKKPPPLIRPSVSKGAAPPEAINIMRQCWAEQADMRPDFIVVHEQFKKLNHGRKVNIVDTMFQMLEKYSNNLEELIRQRTEQLDIEKRKTEQLLNRMLPSTVAEKLKLGMPVDPEEFAEVTIYFSDIVGFTAISAHSTPFQVVDLLNDLYTCFDATINAYSVYKVETIGDAYMVVGGIPLPVADHAEQVATMALDLLHQSGMFRIRHLPKTPLRLRIGLHTGPCCAGVVGLTMPRYCLFGDTVNTASRMESTGYPWKIHMSQATKDKLESASGYKIQYRGPTEIKGKGTMDTYWLLGKDGFDKPLPTAPPTPEKAQGFDECELIFQNSEGKPISQDSMDSDNGILMTINQEGNANNISHLSQQEPVFIKSMECSKFSTLIKSINDQTSLSAVCDCLNLSRHHSIAKSTSSDNPGLPLGNPLSANEVAAALLGASSSSLCGFRQRGLGSTRRIEEEDISTPYSHYKCLSPKDRTGKLRRQFSLDRAPDDGSSRHSTPRKLCKQNSAGAADLEKIDEVNSFHKFAPSISSPTELPSESFAHSFSSSANSLLR